MSIKKLILIFLFTISLNAQDYLFVEFSEAMDTVGLRTVENYELRFAPSSGNVVISTYPYPVRIDSIGLTEFNNLVILFTSEHPDTSGVFQVKVFNVFDLAGNEINLEHNFAVY